MFNGESKMKTESNVIFVNFREKQKRNSEYTLILDDGMMTHYATLAEASIDFDQLCDHNQDVIMMKSREWIKIKEYKAALKKA